MPMINGFVRIVKYYIDNLNQNNLLEITEGRFEKGMKSGYCRVISATSGSCEVGFYYRDDPKGKYCVYKADGTYLQEEGLYDKNCCKSKF